MSVEVIKDQIFQFLSSEEPEVMAIKGDWGVGKTFSWKKFLKEASSNDGIRLKRYSYVSLFGINSLESFKYTIFENTVKHESIGIEEASLETLGSNLEELTKIFEGKSRGIGGLVRKSIGMFKGLKPFKPAIDTISFLSVSNMLICIDDLERKGNGLEIKDVLGLVSLLKEEKNCKVVLLLNDGENGLEDYKKYREKVVDIELAFVPNPKECADIAYSGDLPYYSKIKELTTSLGIRNIRILKKIERLVNLFLPLDEKFEPEITEQVLRSLVLYSWSYFCSSSNEDIPPLDFILSNERIDYLFSIDEKEVEEKEIKWQKILEEYHYSLTDEVDFLLAETVKTGFFVKSEFHDKATIKNQQVVAFKSKGDFSKYWQLYRDTFNDNGTEIINGLYESFKNNFKYMTPINLNSTAVLLRELDEDTKASEIIDIYIEKRKDEIELFNMKENGVSEAISKDQEMIDKFNDAYNQPVVIETINQVFDRIVSGNAWSNDDDVALVNTSIDEYYNLFKNESGNKLSLFIRRLLELGSLENAGERRKDITKKTTQALQRIAAESKINKLRVKRFGVELEDS